MKTGGSVLRSDVQQGSGPNLLSRLKVLSNCGKMAMRPLGLITLVAVAAVTAAAGFFFVKQADADFVAELRGNKPAAEQVAQATPAAAPTPGNGAETKTFARWSVSCRTGADGAGKQCTAQNRIVDQKSGKALFVWVIGKDAQNNFVSYFQTPTGVLIGEGLTLILSESENYKLAFRSCDNRRCDVTAQMGAPFVEKLASLEKVSVRLVATTGHNLVFNIENAGIAQAIGEL